MSARSGAEGARCYHRPSVWERSHRGLVRRFAKPLSGVTCFEGSNPSLSASQAPKKGRALMPQTLGTLVAVLLLLAACQSTGVATPRGAALATPAANPSEPAPVVGSEPTKLD